ncbi:MAG: DUF2442 domain-containing protein [Pseudomonadota bacterium]
MREIVRVLPRHNFLLEVDFDNGERMVFDLKPYLRGSLFEPLADESLFRQVEIEKDFGGLVWPTGADLCPDMVYMNAVAIRAGAHVA